LFHNLAFATNNYETKSSILKVPNEITLSILLKIDNNKNTFAHYSYGNKIIYYHNAPVNWIRTHNFIPYFESTRDGIKKSTQLKQMISLKVENQKFDHSI